jgi:hypothetical protein
MTTSSPTKAAQHSGLILNNGLAAIVSNNSGAAQPSTTYAYHVVG